MEPGEENCKGNRFSDLVDLGIFRLIRKLSKQSFGLKVGHVNLLHCNWKRRRTIKFKCSARKGMFSYGTTKLLR